MHTTPIVTAGPDEKTWNGEVVAMPFGRIMVDDEPTDETTVVLVLPEHMRYKRLKINIEVIEE